MGGCRVEWGDQEERIDELEASRPPAHKTYQDTIDIILENSVHMPREASPEAQKAELNSDHFRLRRAFLILAREHCKQNGPPRINQFVRI
jgi:hypothetical protein